MILKSKMLKLPKKESITLEEVFLVDALLAAKLVGGHQIPGDVLCFGCVKVLDHKPPALLILLADVGTDVKKLHPRLRFARFRNGVDVLVVQILIQLQKDIFAIQI